jgi:transcriptional regulator with XRE-family HTH domain
MTRERRKPKNVTHFLKEWRDFRGLTQERLAARIEKSPALISQIEAGNIKLTEETLEALAFALSCDPGDVLSRDPMSPDYKLWRIIKGLPADDQAQALRVIEALTKKAG